MNQTVDIKSLNKRYNKITSDIKNFMQTKLAPLSYEVFAMIWLDVCGKVIEFEEVSRGDEKSVHIPINLIVKKSIEYKARAVILAHNHPRTNIIKPSKEDIEVTAELIIALGGVKIHVMDHLIVSLSNVYSLKENNQLSIYRFHGNAKVVDNG